MTQLQAAQSGKITAAMTTVAHDEGVAVNAVMEAVAAGHAVIPLNPAHRACRAIGVGRLFRTKVNANIGRSPDRSDQGGEVEKLRVALDAGADFVMDLSVGDDDLVAVRQSLLDHSPLPLGTVPIYETISRLDGAIPEMRPDLLLSVIEQQARQGVDFMTLHAGLLRRHVPLAMRRKMGIVSRGGAIMAEWMHSHDRENPLYECWDEVLAILVQHDVTVSLGDGLRPGCLADASDEAQFAELDVLSELVHRCRNAGVQVMVEGPGHVPFDQIQMNMERQQKLCDGAPFYVLGPVVCDIAPGYDHITSSIGATAAAFHGASLLCYVTPAEHLGLPDADEVRQGLVAHRIAAHAADVARRLPGARARDDAMAVARMSFNWREQFALALDPPTAEARWRRTRVSETGNACDDDHCSMCGAAFCAMRTSNRITKGG